MLGEPFCYAIMTVLSVVKAVRVNGEAIAREASQGISDFAAHQSQSDADDGKRTGMG
jgi:hypothetical protein